MWPSISELSRYVVSLGNWWLVAAGGLFFVVEVVSFFFGDWKWPARHKGKVAIGFLAMAQFGAYLERDRIATKREIEASQRDIADAELRGESREKDRQLTQLQQDNNKLRTQLEGERHAPEPQIEGVRFLPPRVITGRDDAPYG